MPSLRERILAYLDVHLCGLQSATGDPATGRWTEIYWSGWGRPYCIVDEHGRVKTGDGHYSGRTIHVRDWDKNLISRKLAVDCLEPGERVVYGTRNIDEARHQQPCQV